MFTSNPAITKASICWAAKCLVGTINTAWKLFLPNFAIQYLQTKAATSVLPLPVRTQTILLRPSQPSLAKLTWNLYGWKLSLSFTPLISTIVEFFRSVSWLRFRSLLSTVLLLLASFGSVLISVLIRHEAKFEISSSRNHLDRFELPRLSEAFIRRPKSHGPIFLVS